MPGPRHHDVGRLVLLYTDGTNQFSTSVGLLTGSDPFDSALMETKAELWAGYVREVLSPIFTITHWKSLDTNLVEALSFPLTPSVPGTSGTIPGVPGWKSLTACITGMTKEPSAANRIQQTRSFLHVTNTVEVGAQDKEFDRLLYPDWDELLQFLEADETLWGDIQGRKAATRPSIKIQFNAFVQHQLGS